MSSTGSGNSSGNLQGFPTNASPVVDMNNNFRWTQPWLQFMISLWRRTGTAQGSGTSPTGMVMAFGSPSLPPGWVLCDGTEVDRTIYAALFSVIGTLWGPGNGSTTFSLPNFNGRVLVGYGSIPFASRGGAIPTTGGTVGYAAVAYAIKS